MVVVVQRAVAVGLSSFKFPVGATKVPQWKLNVKATERRMVVGLSERRRLSVGLSSWCAS